MQAITMTANSGFIRAATSQVGTVRHHGTKVWTNGESVFSYILYNTNSYFIKLLIQS